MLRFHTNKLSEATVEFPSSSPCFWYLAYDSRPKWPPFLVFIVSAFQVRIFSSFYSNAEFPSWADCNYTSNSSNGLKMPEISRWTRTNTHTAYIHTFVLYWYRYLLFASTFCIHFLHPLSASTLHPLSASAFDSDVIILGVNWKGHSESTPTQKVLMSWNKHVT